MPRRTATLSPMSLKFAASAPSASTDVTPAILGSAEFVGTRSPIKHLLRGLTATALLGASGFAFAQTPVCFNSVGQALPSEQCSQAARDQAAAQATTSGAGEPTKRDQCKALADKIANTPDKPVYTRDQRVDSPAGNRVDIPVRTNPRKTLKEQYMRECS